MSPEMKKYNSGRQAAIVSRIGDVCTVSSLPDAVRPLIQVRMDALDPDAWDVVLSAFWYLKHSGRPFALVVNAPYSLIEDIYEEVDNWKLSGQVWFSQADPDSEQQEWDEVILMGEDLDGLVLRHSNKIIRCEVSELLRELEVIR